MFFRGYFIGMGIGSIIMVIASFYGYSIDPQGYLGNILAEITSMIVTVFFVSIFVDRYNEFQKKKDWEKVRDITYRSILENLHCMIFRLFDIFPEFIRNKVPDEDWEALITNMVNPLVDISKELDDIANIFNEIHYDFIKKSNGKLSKVMIDFYNKNYKSPLKQIPKHLSEYFKNIDHNIDQLRNVLIPRVITISYDKEIIDALIQFDEYCGKLQYIYKRNKFPLMQSTGSLRYATVSVDLMKIVVLINNIKNVYNIFNLYWDYKMQNRLKAQNRQEGNVITDF